MCAALTGTTIGVGVYDIHGSDDWTPLFIAFGAFVAEFIVFVLVLVAILRGLMRQGVSASMPEVADRPTATPSTADTRLSPVPVPRAHPGRQAPRAQRLLGAYVAYAAFTIAVVVAMGLGSVAGAITEILVGRNDFAATGVGLVVAVVAVVPLFRIARLVAHGLTTDRP